VGFELNPHAYAAFVPTLAGIEELPDPVPSTPDAVELARRQKLRDGWKRDRLAKKANKNVALTP